MAEQNPWSFWLEEQPQAAYGVFRPKVGAPSFLNYWRNQKGKVWEDYMGQLGQMALQGQPPSLNWTDYLQSYPFMQKWLGMAPEKRGFFPQHFSPRMFWNLR